MSRDESPAEREPLPEDPDALPSLGDGFRSIVRLGCAELGIELSVPQLSAIEAHARLLLAWNRHINLTAIRGEEDVARLHVVDSLTALPLLRRIRGRARLRVLDLGSGGGYPGIPLGVALPASRTALLDSVGKKARFLETAAAAVEAVLGGRGSAAAAGEVADRKTARGAESAGPSEFHAVLARAEELAAHPDERESYDVVTARAVGSLAEVTELSLPLLRVGGRLIAWKRHDDRGTLRDELAAAGPLIHATGGGRPEVADVSVTSLPGHCLVVIRKSGRTPGRFPRPPAERRRT